MQQPERKSLKNLILFKKSQCVMQTKTKRVHEGATRTGKDICNIYEGIFCRELLLEETDISKIDKEHRKKLLMF